jgi:hypothetical protein
MPIPKRYFHCSQEIIADPEVWEFTSEFGDRALRTWLQILIYLERSDNQWRLAGEWLAVLSRTTRQSVANCSRQIRWLVAKEWLLVGESAADGSPLVLNGRNWLKYNKTRGRKNNLLTPDQGADEHPLRTVPYRTVPIKNTPTPLVLTPEELAERFNAIPGVKPANFIDGKLPKTIHEKSRCRIKEHNTQEFWETFLKLIQQSSFLTGKVPGRDGDEPFRASFDWIMGPKNFDKVLSGKYSDQPTQPKKRIIYT